MQNILNYIHKRKYEFLLFALIQHLFIGIFLSDLPFYKVIWPINMLILGIASVGVFIEKGRWKNIIQKILFLIVLVLPIGLTFWGNNPYYFIFLNIGYVIFFPSADTGRNCELLGYTDSNWCGDKDDRKSTTG